LRRTAVKSNITEPLPKDSPLRNGSVSYFFSDEYRMRVSFQNEMKNTTTYLQTELIKRGMKNVKVYEDIYKKNEKESVNLNEYETGKKKIDEVAVKIIKNL